MNLYTSWACPLSAHGHGSVRPIFKARRALFLSSSATPFTPLVHHPWEEGPNGVTVQNSSVDGSNACGLMVSMRMPSTVQTSDRLSRSHYGAWHVLFFDWFLSRIKALLHLPCTSPINTRVYLSHFFIFNWNILSERNRHPCQRPPRSFCYSNHWHTPSVHLLHSSSTHFLCSSKKLVSVLFPWVL